MENLIFQPRDLHVDAKNISLECKSIEKLRKFKNFSDYFLVFAIFGHDSGLLLAHMDGNLVGLDQTVHLRGSLLL